MFKKNRCHTQIKFRILYFHVIGSIFLACNLQLSYASLSSAVTEPISIKNLADFDHYAPKIKSLILNAQHLSQMKLTYLYGSASPNNKGMDCSGTIYYLLNQMGIHDVPRQSDQQFMWVEKAGHLYKVTKNDFNSNQFSALKPGDLLFWSGTYIVQREMPITHVMIYLGKNNQGQRLMFGASDGRTYRGKKMWGVSVFDFKLPNGKGPQKFIGYSCIPHLTCND